LSSYSSSGTTGRADDERVSSGIVLRLQKGLENSF